METKQQKLERRLKRYSEAYYQGKPLISDKAFDKLLKQLRELEGNPTSEITTTPGSDLLPGFKKVHRDLPMLSIDNAYSISGCEAFIIKAGLEEVVVEDKIDGVSLSLIYKNGKLHQASTRGDGFTGDDVTAQAMNIRNIPKTITNNDESFEVRGEVMISNQDFKSLKEEGDFANPRNLTAGTIKSLDPSLCRARKLSFVAFSIPRVNRAQVDQLQWLSLLGFMVPSYKVCDLTSLVDTLNQFDKDRSLKPYPIDGAVIKANRPAARESLGVGTKYVNWAIAYKYDTEKAETKILSIDYQVGRSGVITPVANLEPVQLAGTTVKRATLHNVDMLNQFQIGPGDTIILEKAGEIIPHILGVAHRLKGKRFQAPALCPIFKSWLKLSDSGVQLRCPNTFGKCTQFAYRLTHFASRPALNIQGLGEETCLKLPIDSLSELFNLCEEDLLQVEGFSHRSAQKLLFEIRKATKKPFETWLFALGIPLVGKVNARTIAQHFTSWHKIRTATYQDLTSLPGIGKEIAQSIITFFQNKEHLKDLRALKEAGMPKTFNKAQVEGPLKGMVIAITGTYHDMARPDFQTLVESKGAQYSSSVNRKVTHLLKGSGGGKAKLERAKLYGIPIISELD